MAADPVEVLAELEHEQWVEWSRSIAESEDITPERIERWGGYWIPYDELDEPTKEHDRVWARRAMDRLAHAGWSLTTSGRSRSAPPLTGMWEFVDGAPFTDEGVQHAVDVLSRLSSALRPDDQVGAIEITIGPRRWRYRQLPAMLLAMPDGGPVTAILGPEGVDRG